MYILIVFLYTTVEWFCVWASEKHGMETNMSIVQKFLSCEYLEFYFLTDPRALQQIGTSHHLLPTRQNRAASTISLPLKWVSLDVSLCVSSSISNWTFKFFWGSFPWTSLVVILPLVILPSISHQHILHLSATEGYVPAALHILHSKPFDMCECVYNYNVDGHSQSHNCLLVILWHLLRDI